MTREEAIEVLENGGWWDLLIPITTIEGRVEEDRLHEALDLALAALRTVSREQVEKVWRGKWIIQQDEHKEYRKKCSRCGFPISGWWGADKFCANCGAPMTDEAVQMVMERLEGMRNDKND